MQLPFVIVILIAVLIATGLGALLWRRFYRDDPSNAARRIFKNSAITFGLRLLVRGLDTVVLFVLVGSLAPAEVGTYSLAALLVAQYLGTFSEFGLGILLTREVARDPQAAPRLFGATLSLRLLLVMIGAVPISLVVIGAYALLAHVGLGDPITPSGQQAIWVLILTLVPSAYSGAVTALYNAAERMEVPAMIEVVTAAISFLARISVLLLGWGVLGLAWSAVAVSSLTAVVFFFLQQKDFFAPSLSLARQPIMALVPSAFPLMLNNLLSAIFFRFDLFIIRGFGGSNADTLVQQYALPYQLLNIALVLPPAVTFAVFPLLARRAAGERSAMADAQRRTLGLLLIIAFPLAMGMAVLASDLVWIFARRNFDAYQPSVHVLAILAWFLPLSFVNGLLQYVLIALNRQTAITRAFVIGAVANLSMNLVAIPVATLFFGQPTWGLYAAAVITIISEAVLYLVFRPLLIGESVAPRLLHLSWRPLLAALVMGGCMLGLRLPFGAPWGSLTAILIAPPSYAVVLWLLGGIGAEERALVQRVIGRG
ncbi:oligosaccharide flippase family protein [Candidatus Oscillochloris fontis]|uniref:oligosaccharide flippase family protein n=1 Tax=Candidatus Oscillochloris fontis TaxID=2496868 RepID=UPI00101E08ED|nr:oligosaccharide flippase family protein [Candidatus Oscillochloris fontis]